MAGTRGVDSVPVMMGRGETAIDHTLTDELRAFIRRPAQAGPVIGTLNVTATTAFSAWTREDARRFGRVTAEVTRRHVEEATAIKTLA